MKHTRGQFLRYGGGALAGVYVLGLVGCGGGGSGGGQGGTATTLRMAWWGETTRNERTNEVLRMFERRNPNVDVKAEFGEFDTYFDKLSTQTAGGNAPDLMQMDVSFLGEYARRNVLLDLNQFVPDTIDLSTFDEGLLESGRLDGKLLGIPLGTNAHAMLFDRAALERAGVRLPDTTDWTWEDYERVASDVARAGGDDFYGSADLGGDAKAFEIFVRGRGRELYTAEGTLGATRGDVSDWFAYWGRLRESGAAVPADVQATDEGDPTQSVLVRGISAADFAFSNQLGSIEELAGNPLEMTMMPKAPDATRPGQYLKAAMLISASARTEGADQAAALIDFMINNKEAVRTLGVDRGIPGSEKARNLLEPELNETDQRVLDFIELVRDDATPLTILSPQGAGEVEGILLRVYQDVSFGRQSVEEGADQFVSEAERALS